MSPGFGEDLIFPSQICKGFSRVYLQGGRWETGAKGNLSSFMCQKSWRHSGLTSVPSVLTRFIPRCANCTGDLGSPQQGRCLRFTVRPLDLGHASFAQWPGLTLAINRRARLVQRLRGGRRCVGDGTGNDREPGRKRAGCALLQRCSWTLKSCGHTEGVWAEPMEGLHGRLDQTQRRPWPFVTRLRSQESSSAPRLWDAVKTADRLEMPARPGFAGAGRGEIQGGTREWLWLPESFPYEVRLRLTGH